MENKHEFLWKEWGCLQVVRWPAGCGRESGHPDGVSAVPTALLCPCGVRRAELPGRAALYLATKCGRKGKGKGTARKTVV